MKCNRCGKENPAEIHTCTPPLAIALADALEDEPLDWRERLGAASELRRLHAENIELAAKVDVAKEGYLAAIRKAHWQEASNRELNRHMDQKFNLRDELKATERQVEILNDELSKCSKENEALREALRIARDHIEMDALEISHCKDAAMIRAALAWAGEVK